MSKEPMWIVNSLGELGVKVNGRCFFLYKGDNIEYSPDEDETEPPILYRRVGKREFGETQCPARWIDRRRGEDVYLDELTPGLGQTSLSEESHWRPLPIPPKE